MKKIVIIPSNTDLNRGDQALVWETHRLAKEIGYEKHECYLFDAGTNINEIEMQKKQSISQGYKFLTPILSHPESLEYRLHSIFKVRPSSQAIKYSLSRKVLWGLKASFDVFTKSLLLSGNSLLYSIGYSLLKKEKREALTILRESDAVFVKGGGFIHSLDKGLISDYYVFYSVFHIWLANSLGKKVYIMPNSYGPFPSKISKWLIKKSLKNVEFISAREQISKGVLESVINKDVAKYPDLGFFLEINEQKKTEAYDYLVEKQVPIEKNKLVGVTVRPYRFPKSSNPEEKYAQYIHGISEFCKYLIGKGYHPVLISQTLGPSDHENDYLAIEAVINRLAEETIDKYSVIHDFELNCIDVKSIYSHMDYLIGTRFHSVIFALTSHVKSIAIGYGGNKGKGIMEDAKLTEYQIPIEEADDKTLISKFEQLVNDDSYQEKLKQYLTFIEKKRKELIDHLVD
ncbi:polysaccharide pyruvyl transferase family protein [Priestia megaterium]|uniref:polysaccharide pyruvyl transferase family protein n=1 Tax=Priestia megaterium TaxID=1404 RepID=UPI001BEB336A|nr:polysaccharide pyruvyl transferase family protein [Priestia megaterium]MBT2259239.1 polysaccharide pyruvyl transferase family protein [Priestia megaterium]